MGNYKFKLSDMIPNAWFYKLKDMNKLRRTNPINNKITQLNPRKSIYQTTEFDLHFAIDPPSKKKPKRNTIYKPSVKQIIPSVSPDLVFQDLGIPVWLKPQTIQVKDYLESELDGLQESAPSPEFQFSDDRQKGFKVTTSDSDIVLDMEKRDLVAEFDMIMPSSQLHPILTVPINKLDLQEEEQSPTKKTTVNPRKSTSRSRGIKITGNWAKKKGKKNPKTDHRKERFYSESFAVVKSSFDPVSDFRESMKEMIVENNIQTLKDLEQLLACYLSLNTDQYHDAIIKAFEQIWFDISNLSHKLA